MSAIFGLGWRRPNIGPGKKLTASAGLGRYVVESACVRACRWPDPTGTYCMYTGEANVS